MRRRKEGIDNVSCWHRKTSSTLVDGLNFAEKVERSLRLIQEAYKEYGDRLVVANSLGKDSCAVWDLAQTVSPRHSRVHRHHALQAESDHRVHEGDRRALSQSAGISGATSLCADRLYETDPDRCCDILKVEPTRRAIEEMNVACWVTGLRCTEGRTRTDFQEIEERDKGLHQAQSDL